MASEVAIGQSVIVNAELFQHLMQAKTSNSKVSVKIDIVRNERHNVGVLVLREASDSSSRSLTTLQYEPSMSDSSSSCGPELQLEEGF
jgi:hypothetical protein